MRRVMAFVGEPFDEAWLAARLAAQAGEGAPAAGSGSAAGSAAGRPTTGAAAPSTTNKPNAAGAISTGSIGRWRRDLTPAEIQLIRDRAEARLIELGYETPGQT